MNDESRILHDRGTGRPILMSPGRLLRPRDTGLEPDNASECPFCEGHEHLTNRECDAIRDQNSPPNGPGWTARAFPNLYPATNHHELIVEGAEHAVHPAAIPVAVLADSLALYRRRLVALEALTEVRLALLFKNVGAEAGATIAHNHSQLLGLPMLPPRLEKELAACRTGCIHCEEIATADLEDRVIQRTAHYIVLCPSTPKFPHEVWMLPLDHDEDFLAPELPAELEMVLRDLFDLVNHAFGGGSFNLSLHRIPELDFHWHFELQPRLAQMAALEIGADIYVNGVTPQASAVHWRGDSRGNQQERGTFFRS